MGARAASVIVTGIDDATAADEALLARLRELRPAGILLLSRNVVDGRQVRNLIGTVRTALPDEILVATDEEGGRVSAFRAVLGPLPSARQLAREPRDELRRHACHVAAELASCGIDWNYAPVADIDASDAGAPIGDRSFSADAATAVECASAVAAGQRDAGVIPCAKHFPGQGRARADTHLEEAVVEAQRAELLATDVAPFAALIRDGVPAVMVGHAIYTALNETLPASMSASVYRLLRNLGFSGVAVTDSLAMSAITARFGAGEAAVRAVAAGADAILTSRLDDAVEMRDALVVAVCNGRLGQARLDEAAARLGALRRTQPAVDPGRQETRASR